MNRMCVGVYNENICTYTYLFTLIYLITSTLTKYNSNLKRDNDTCILRRNSVKRVYSNIKHQSDLFQAETTAQN